jgi:small subunit ribosomal protein S36
VTGDESVARTAAFVPLLIPQLAYIGGAVNNDGAAIAATAVVWTLLMTLTRSGPTPRRLILLGVALGAAFWTKGTALTLLPAVPLALAIAYRRSRPGPLRRWAPPAALATFGSLGLALAVGGWWWAVNLVRYGTLQPAAVATPLIEGHARDLGGFLVAFLARLRWTLIGEVGGREPQVFYLMTVVVAWVFVVLGLVGLASRRRLGERLVMLASIVPTVGVLFSTAYKGHQLTKGFPGIQGRYLFVLVVPVVILVAVGLARVAALVRLPVRWLPPVTALAAVGIALLGLALGFRVYYGGNGGPWGADVDRFIAWAPVPPSAILSLIGLFALSVLVLAWVLGAGRSSEQVNAEPLRGDCSDESCETRVTQTA